MGALRSRSQKGSVWDSSLLFLRKYSEAILVAVVIGILTRWLVAAPYLVKSSDLRPHFFPGDLVVGIKIPFSGVAKWVRGGNVQDENLAKRWTWVVYNCAQSEDLCMHQVVGVPGDRIEVRGSTLWVNESETNYAFGESSVPTEQANGSQSPEDPVIVPPGHIWVFPSKDQGESGKAKIGVPVPLPKIVAEVKFIFLSVQKDKERGVQIHWDRFLHSVN